MGRAIKRRVFWNQAGFGGLIVGGILSVATLSSYFLRENPEVNGVVSNVLLLSAFIIVPYILGKKFSTKNALWGLSFQRALAYMFVVYLLSGFIYGISVYITLNMDVDYYIAQYQKWLSGIGIDTMKNESIENMISNCSPIQMAFSSMLTLPMVSFLPAFIISAIIKRGPAIRD